MDKGFEQCDKCDYFISVEEAYKQGKAYEREHILEILHGIDRQIENLVIAVLMSELKEQK